MTGLCFKSRRFYKEKYGLIVSGVVSALVVFTLNYSTSTVYCRTISSDYRAGAVWKQSQSKIVMCKVNKIKGSTNLQLKEDGFKFIRSTSPDCMCVVRLFQCLIVLRGKGVGTVLGFGLWNQVIQVSCVYSLFRISILTNTVSKNSLNSKCNLEYS